VGASSNKPVFGELTLSRAPLSWASVFVSDLVTDIKGEANGKITFGGTYNRPDLKGTIALKDAGAHVVYTGVDYTSPNELLTANNKGFKLGNITMYDRFQNTANVTGTISHDFFTDFRLQIQMKSPKFEVINLESNENDVFYGQCIADASLSVNGRPDDLRMSIKAEPAASSHLYLPITDGGTFSNSTFVSFKPIDSNEKNTFQSYKPKSKLTLNIAAVVNPLLNVTMILDPISGDQINAKGDGNIALEMSTGTDLRMYGKLNIDE